MAIFKKIEANFAQISNDFLQSKDISLEAKGLLSYMLSLPNDWDFTIEGISKATNTNTHKLIKILNELESFGYHKKEQSFENGRIKDWVYYTYAEPQQDIIDGYKLKLQQKEQREKEKALKTLGIKEDEQSVKQQCRNQQSSNLECCSEGDIQTNKKQINIKKEEDILSKDNILENSKKTFVNDYTKKLENEKEQKNKQKRVNRITKNMKLEDLIKEFTTNEDVIEKLEDYLEFRKKQGLTYASWKSILTNFFKKFGDKTTSQQLEQIDYCFRKSYRDLDYSNTFNGNIKTSYSSSNTYQDNCASHDTSDDPKFNEMTKEEKEDWVLKNCVLDENGLPVKF